MTTNNKVVKEMIQKHILEYQTINELRENVKALQYPRKYNNFVSTPSQYDTIVEMVQGGMFLIYNVDIKDFINSLGINPSGKEYDTQKTWDLYKHLIAREGVRLLEGGAN